MWVTIGNTRVLETLALSRRPTCRLMFHCDDSTHGGRPEEVPGNFPLRFDLFFAQARPMVLTREAALMVHGSFTTAPILST